MEKAYKTVYKTEVENKNLIRSITYSIGSANNSIKRFGKSSLKSRENTTDHVSSTKD